MFRTGLAVGRGIVVKTVSGEKLHGDFITATDDSLVIVKGELTFLRG